MMPGLDGFGLLREIRADGTLSSVPVILLSARAGEESRVEGLQAGADDYLVKPFSARELLARVATHLQLARFRTAAEAERARLFSIFEQAPIAIAVFRGPEHIVELANEPHCRMVGRRQDDMIGRPIRQIYPEPASTGIAEIYDRVLATGTPFVASEYRAMIDRGNGLEEHYYNTSVVPLRSADGSIDALVSVAVDITGQVQAKHEREQTGRFAEQFIGILGHDLRNPLNSIVMASGLLIRKLEGTPDGRTIEIVASAADRMSRMVNQLLDLARGRLGGGIPIAPRAINLSEVVAGALDELRTAHPSRHIQCVVPDAVIGGWDADRLAQVVSNLVGNAIEHGEPELPIRVRLEQEGDTATLTVQNHGKPIPADMLPVLFEAFRRGSETTGKISSGLGLGLYITDQIVRAHGGVIAVHSDATATTFTVRLPIRSIGAHGEPELSASG